MPKTPLRSYQLFWGRFQRGCLLMEPNEPQWYTIHFTVWTNIQKSEFYQIGSLNHKKKSLPYVSAVYTVVGQSSTKKSSRKERCDIQVMRQFSFLLGHCALTGQYVLQNAVHCDFLACTTWVKVAFSLVTHDYLALKSRMKLSKCMVAFNLIPLLPLHSFFHQGPTTGNCSFCKECFCIVVLSLDLFLYFSSAG